MPRHIDNFPEASREYIAAHFAHMEDELRWEMAEAKKKAEVLSLLEDYYPDVHALINSGTYGDIDAYDALEDYHPDEYREIVEMMEEGA